MGWNVRQKQKDVLARVLNLNTSTAPGKDPSEVYKVLILDRFSTDVIAPLLRVSELRKYGVTLHLMIETERQPIPDVPAVYIVRPTEENIQRIISDAAAGLYETMYLNFTTSLPSKLIEQLATGTVKAEAANRIVKVYDQYVSFIGLEPNLFTLGLPDTYVQLNDPAAQDTAIEAVATSIVNGLFSVCVTLGVVPVIRCPPRGVAEHVASMLDSKLRDALRARNNLFAEGAMGAAASLTRPLLLLLDRNFDLAAGLTHSWTYKPMVHDVLGLKLNRLELSGGETAKAGAALTTGKKSYDVDENDFLWEAQGSQVFPKVMEEVDVEIKKYKSMVDEFNQQQVADVDDPNIDETERIRRKNQAFKSAMLSLPEQQERKKVIDKHLNICTSLLSIVKARSLEAWQPMEEDMLSGKGDFNTFIKQLTGSKGSAVDRLRLALIWLLTTDGVPPESSYSEVEAALKSHGADTSALAYVRSLKRNNLVGNRSGQDGTTGGGSAAAQGGAALFDYVTKLGKTLLAGGRTPPVCAALEAVMEGKAGTPEHDTYCVFDPKAPAGRAGPDRAKGPFREGMVFIIGGGSYAEREAVISWAAKAGQPASAAAGVLAGATGASSTGPKSVLYGATEVLSGEELSAQLAKLAMLSGLGTGHLLINEPPAAPGAAGHVPTTAAH